MNGNVVDSAIRRFRSYGCVRNQLVEWSLGQHIPLAQIWSEILSITGVNFSADIAQDGKSVTFALREVIAGCRECRILDGTRGSTR